MRSIGNPSTSHERGFTQSRTSESRGFTLIELLVVIAIIGILSSVVLASLNTARQKGRDARRISDLKQLKLALELYYDASGSTYPTSGQGLAVLAPTYIAMVPTDPQGSSYIYAGGTSGGADCSTGPCPGYVIKAILEGTVPAGSVTGTTYGQSCVPVANKEYCVRP